MQTDSRSSADPPPSIYQGPRDPRWARKISLARACLSWRTWTLLRSSMDFGISLERAACLGVDGPSMGLGNLKVPKAHVYERRRVRTPPRQDETARSFLSPSINVLTYACGLCETFSHEGLPVLAQTDSRSSADPAPSIYQGCRDPRWTLKISLARACLSLRTRTLLRPSVRVYGLWHFSREGCLPLPWRRLPFDGLRKCLNGGGSVLRQDGQTGPLERNFKVHFRPYV